MRWEFTASHKQQVTAWLAAMVVALFYVTPFRGVHEGAFYLLLASIALLPPRDGNYWRQIVRSLKNQPLLWMVLVYLIYQWISLGWNEAANVSEYGEAIRKGKFSFFWMLILATTVAATAGERVILQLWVIAATVSALLGLPDSSVYGTDERFIGFGRIENAVQAGCFYGAALLAASHLAWQDRPDRPVANIYIVCGVLLFAALLATQSRGALLAALAAYGVWMLPCWKRLWPVVLAIFLAAYLMADWQGLLARADGSRLEIWRNVLAEWQSQPILGMGYRTAYTQALSNGQVIYQPHSLYMTALYQGGILGLLCLLAVWGTAFYYAWKSRAESQLPLILCIFGFVIGIFDYSILLVNVQGEWLLFWLPWGWVLGQQLRKGRADENPA